MLLPTHARIFLAASIFSLGTPSYAFNEDDLFSDIPKVSTATRIPQNLADIPASTTVITQELIKSSGAVDIPELFRLVPGFQVYQANANKYAVTYHGASGEYPRHLDVRINGRPAYIPLLSTVAWNTLGISLQDIQRIEVIRGSNVPSYGSNALMGAINIITKAPVETQTQTVSGMVGAQGRRDVFAAFSGKTDDFYYRVSLGQEKNHGFDFQRDGERVNLGNVHLTFTPSLYDNIDFSAGFTDGYIGIGQGKKLSDYQDREQTSHFQYLRWEHTASESVQINTQLYHNYLKLSTESILASEILEDPRLVQLNTALAYLAYTLGPNYPFSSTSVSDFPVLTSAENGATHTYGAEVQSTFALSNEVTLASGIGLRYEEATSESLLNTSDTITEETYYVFSNAEWKPNTKLSLNGGVMSELSSITRPATSFRLAANYQATDTFTLRGSMTQAYRTPSLLEENGQSAYIFPEGVPYDYITFANDSIGSEKLRAAELGAIWQLPHYNGFIDMKLFREQISDGLDSWFFEGPVDLLSLSQNYLDEARELRNTGKRITKGFEVQASFKPTKNNLIHLAYAYSTLEGIQRRGELQSRKFDRPFDNRVPAHTATLLLNHRFSPSLDSSLIFHYLSDVQWLDSSLEDRIKTVDLKMSHSLPIGKQKTLNTQLLVKNLFDYHYSEFQLRNTHDRRLYLTMSLDF